jgi:hypothetical protein
VADPVVALLDHQDPSTRAAALRIAIKLGERRVTLAHPLALLTAPPAGGPGHVAGRWLAEIPTAIAAVRFLLDAELTTLGAAARALEPLAAHPSWLARVGAARLASAIGPAGSSLLARLARDRDPLVKAEAAAGEVSRSETRPPPRY